ncbi:MAG: hypothetical protein P8M11_15115 [Planctomycetota bacterium]|nr:hypothetical protein [Planctomycetota bacterium]MDG1985885.1 hypothetical protein [Planctomycetota bacterium]
MPFLVLALLLAGVFAAPTVLLERSWEVGSRVQAVLDRGVEPSNDVVEVSILRLKNARYRKGRPLPEWVEELNGKKISLWGYMAIGTLEGLNEFELVPESCECGKSKVNHFVQVSLDDDVTRFIPGRITLVGTFTCGEVEEDGFITSVYRLTTDELP